MSTAKQTIAVNTVYLQFSNLFLSACPTFLALWEAYGEAPPEHRARIFRKMDPCFDNVAREHIEYYQNWGDAANANI